MLPLDGSDWQYCDAANLTACQWQSILDVWANNSKCDTIKEVSEVTSSFDLSCVFAAVVVGQVLLIALLLFLHNHVCYPPKNDAAEDLDGETDTLLNERSVVDAPETPRDQEIKKELQAKMQKQKQREQMRHQVKIREDMQEEADVAEIETQVEKSVSKSKSSPEGKEQIKKLMTQAHAIDMDAAERHLEQTSPLDERGKTYPFWRSRVSDMRKVGGVGIECYFRLLMYLGVTFSVMSVIQLPVLVFSIAGKMAPDSASFMRWFTIGNLGYQMPYWKGELIFPNISRMVVMGCTGVKLAFITSFLGFLDFVSVSVFTCVVLWYYWFSVPKTQRNADEVCVTCGDYAVEVNNLPRYMGQMKRDGSVSDDHLQYANILAKFLESQLVQARMGGLYHPAGMEEPDVEPKICEVTLVRDHNQRLDAIKWRAELMLEQKMYEDTGEDEAAAALQKKIDSYNDIVLDFMHPEQLPVLRAFVVVNTTFDRQCLLNMYRFSDWWFLRIFGCGYRQFKGYTMRMSGAPEPSNILWENQDFPLWNRRCRQFWNATITALLIAFAVSLIWSGQEVSKRAITIDFGGEPMCDSATRGTDTQVNSTDSDACTDTSWANESLSDMNLTYAQALGEEALNCWCASAINDGYWIYPSAAAACTGYVNKVMIATIISLAGSITSILVNQLLRIVIQQLVYWERPLSRSYYNTSMMQKTFGCYTVNFAIIILLVQGSPFQPMGRFDDFGRDWYSVVGIGLTMTMCINAFTVPITSLAMCAVNSLRRLICKKRCTHQAQLIQLFTNPEFDIAAKYAMLLTQAFVTMMYNSGLPLLNVAAAVFCFLTYWADKAVLLKASCLPPDLDGMLPRQASRFLICAVPFHCVFTILMYGHTCLFPSSSWQEDIHPWVVKMANHTIGLTNDTHGHASIFEHHYDILEQIADRSSRGSTIWHSLLLLLTLVTFFLSAVLWFFGGSFHHVAMGFGRCFCKDTCSEYTENYVDAADHLTWAEACTEIKTVHPPASYKMEANREYESIAKYLIAPDSVEFCTIKKRGLLKTDNIDSARVRDALVNDAVPPPDQESLIQFLESRGEVQRVQRLYTNGVHAVRSYYPMAHVSNTTLP